MFTFPCSCLSWSVVEPLLSPSLVNLWFGSLFFFLYTCHQVFYKQMKMAGRVALAVGTLCASLTAVCAQSSASENGLITTVTCTSASSSAVADATTSYRAIFTVPSNADNSVPLLPNIYDVCIPRFVVFSFAAVERCISSSSKNSCESAFVRHDLANLSDRLKQSMLRMFALATLHQTSRELHMV